MASFIEMIDKRKIAFFIPTLNIGGTEHSFVKLANALVKQGEQVQMVLSRKEGILQDELADEVELIDLGHLRFRTSFFALKSYIEREQPTHLITGSNMHNEFVILVNMLSKYKTKVILTQGNFLDVEIKHIPIYRYVYQCFMRCFYPKAYKVVAVSKGIASFLNEFIPHLPLVQIYNPFDIEDIIEKSNILPENLASSIIGQDYILFVGRFVEIKNLNLLLDAFLLISEQQSQLKLVMTGDGVLFEQLKQRVADLNLIDKVEFTGSIPNAYALMKHAKALVLPSFSESLGGVLIEALALGTTVVSSPTLGGKEVLEDGKFGYLSADFTDARAFADVMVEAIDKPMDVAMLKKRAFDFNSEKISREYLAILD